MDVKRKCEECSHFVHFFNIGNWTECVQCELTNRVIMNYGAETCDLYNKDISEEDICFNCKHFLGGGDWGLACSKHYHSLPHALDKMCKDGEFK